MKNKALKVSMATLALLMGSTYVASNYQITPTYAQVTRIENSKNLINETTKWKYLDNNVDPGTNEDRYAWTKADYQDGEWKEAAGKFGAKNGAIADLGGGLTPNVLLNQYIEGTKNDIPTFFFRTTVNITDLEEFNGLSGNLYYDDAAIVYINGVKVASFDEPTEGFELNMSYGGSNAGTPKEGNIALTKDQLKDVIKSGENTIAVELHQGRASSSDVYFEFSNLQADYGQDQETEVEQKALNLTVGKDETEMNLTWYANTNSQATVQLAEAGAMVNGEFPSKFTTIEAKSKMSSDSGFYYNQATLTNLKENTKYVYRVVNGDKVSQTYDFTTKNFDGSYNFIFAGDPQIGAGSTATDTEGWDKTLEDSVNKFNPNFILSAGDQVNTADDEKQYAGYLNHDELTTTPQATTIGNHDSGSNAYSQHFNLPNITDKGATNAGSDYWYVYNNTLFMNINTNNMSTAEHKAFLEAALKANPNVRWKVVAFHHSVYSAANHAVEGDILQRRNELTPVFDELGIDVVLMGHDHVYVRSNIMKDMQVVEDTTNLDSVTDPQGILYITANSASGSKYYNIKTNIDTTYAAKIDQSKQRSISNVEVTDNQFKITTYNYDSSKGAWETLDTFAINKTSEVDNDKLEESYKQIEGLKNEVNKFVEDMGDVIPADAAAKYRSLLKKADELLANKNATQAELDTVIAELNQAKQELVDLKEEIANDKLEEAYKQIEELKNTISSLIEKMDNIQAEAASKYNSLLEKVNALLADKNATQAELDKVIAELNQVKQEIANLKGEAGKPNTGTNTENSTGKGTQGSSVKTGDNTELLAYGTLLFSALGCSLVTLKSRKAKKEN